MHCTKNVKRVHHTGVLYKTAKPIEMPFGVDSCVSKEPCIRRSQDPHGKEQFRWVSGLLKSIGSFCMLRCMQQNGSINPIITISEVYDTLNTSIP